MDTIEAPIDEPLLETTLIEWDALEYAESDTNKYFYIGFGIFFILLIAFFAYSRDFFGAGFCLILAVCLFYYKSQKPRKFHYKITQLGLYVNEKLYPYTLIHSFSLNSSEKPNLLNFVFAKIYMPGLTVVMDNIDVFTVKSILEKFLPQGPDNSGALTNRIIKFLRLR